MVSDVGIFVVVNVSVEGGNVTVVVYCNVDSVVLFVTTELAVVRFVGVSVLLLSVVMLLLVAAVVFSVKVVTAPALVAVVTEGVSVGVSVVVVVVDSLAVFVLGCLGFVIVVNAVLFVF